MPGGGGYYKYRCKYWLTHDCPHWVWVNNAPCAHCLADGRDNNDNDEANNAEANNDEDTNNNHVDDDSNFEEENENNDHYVNDDKEDETCSASSHTTQSRGWLTLDVASTVSSNLGT